MLFNVIHSAMGDREVTTTEEAGAVLHMLGAELIVQLQCTELFLYNTLPGNFGVWFLTRFITQELVFSFSLRHGDLK